MRIPTSIEVNSLHGFSTHFLKPLGLAPLRAGTISKRGSPPSYPSVCSEQHEYDPSSNDQAFLVHVETKVVARFSATFGAFHLIKSRLTADVLDDWTLETARMDRCVIIV